MAAGCQRDQRDQRVLFQFVSFGSAKLFHMPWIVCMTDILWLPCELLPGTSAMTGVSALAESLQKNRTLQYLALDNNQISQQPGRRVDPVDPECFQWAKSSGVIPWPRWTARLGVAALAKTLHKNRVMQQLLVLHPGNLLFSEAGNPKLRDWSQNIFICWYSVWNVFLHPDFDTNPCVKTRCMTVKVAHVLSSISQQVHTYIHLHTYIRTYVQTDRQTDRRTDGPTDRQTDIHTYTYIHIHTHTYTYIHIHTHKYTYIHIHIHTHSYTYIHIHTHTYTYIHIRTHTYTYVHIRTHTYFTLLYFTLLYFTLHYITYIHTWYIIFIYSHIFPYIAIYYLIFPYHYLICLSIYCSFDILQAFCSWESSQVVPGFELHEGSRWGIDTVGALLHLFDGRMVQNQWLLYSYPLVI